ncbi:hypothetical protein PTKIN_Ptkin03bG0178300 [Pterospermum kingtungense]
MFDLKCDALIIEMFQHFLRAVRDYHAEAVFKPMVTIMTLVLEVSEYLYMEGFHFSQKVLPVARRFLERVVENSASKLIPYLTKAVETFGISFDGYCSVVASICQVTPGAVEQNDLATDKCVDDETKPAETPFDKPAQERFVSYSCYQFSICLHEDKEIPKESLSKEPTSSFDDVSKKASGMPSDSKAKSNRKLGNAPVDVDETNNEIVTGSGLDEKSLKQLSKKVDSSSNNVDGYLPRQLDLEDKKRRALGKVAPEKDGTKTSTKNDDNASNSKEYCENLVGLKVKVWWPKDGVLLIFLLVFCSLSAISYAERSNYSDCNNCKIAMKPMTFCFPYLLGSSIVPSRRCCMAYVSMLDKNCSCVCKLFDQTYTSNIRLNSTQILSLGGSCGRPSSILATCTVPAPLNITVLTSPSPTLTTTFITSSPPPFWTYPPLSAALVKSSPARSCCHASGRLPDVWHIVGIGLLSCLILGLMVLTVYCLRRKYFPDSRAFDYKKCP